MSGHGSAVDTGVVESAHAELFAPLHAGYRSEVDAMLAVFRDLGPVGSVIDLGCGRGGHLSLLAAAGLEVVGVDRSADMAGRAREALAQFADRAGVIEADLFDVAVDRSFDATIVMSSLLGSQVTNQRILRALDVAARLLRPNGLVLFDYIDGKDLLAVRRPVRGLAIIDEVNPQLLCGHTSTVRTGEQVYELALRMWRLDGNRVVDRVVAETYVVRYFLPRELALLLQAAGFELIGTAPLAGQQDPARTWRRLAWARKS